MAGKTYERAFMADLAAINKVCPVVPDYTGGMPHCTSSSLLLVSSILEDVGD
jgi:hypothetical protein